MCGGGGRRGRTKALMPKLETGVRQMLDYAREMVHG